jgi:hypothetical protein
MSMASRRGRAVTASTLPDIVINEPGGAVVDCAVSPLDGGATFAVDGTAALGAERLQSPGAQPIQRVCGKHRMDEELVP